MIDGPFGFIKQQNKISCKTEDFPILQEIFLSAVRPERPVQRMIYAFSSL